MAEQESKNAQELEDATLKDYENKINEYLDNTREISNNALYPDYVNREGITFDNKSYTVEKDGYIQVAFSYTTALSDNANDHLYINGVMVHVNHVNTKWANTQSPMFLVKSGDVISYGNTAQIVTGYYYPFR